jgi:hypothetical protein
MSGESRVEPYSFQVITDSIPRLPAEDFSRVTNKGAEFGIQIIKIAAHKAPIATGDNMNFMLEMTYFSAFPHLVKPILISR